MSLIAYGVIILGILGALGGLYGTIHHSGVKEGRADVQKSWDATNELARKRAISKDAENKKAKEKSDAENSKTRRDLAGLYDAYRSLRDQPRHGSLLPPTASGAASPATATFDRATLDSALSGFDKGVTGLLRQGDEAITDLNTAKKWAKP